MGKGKTKQAKVNVSAAPFHVVTPGGKDHAFTTPTEVAAFLRDYLAGGDGGYIVATGDGTPIQFDPYDGRLYSREEAVDELILNRSRMRDLHEQIEGFRGVKNAKALQAIAAGLIPVDVLKGHIHKMEYEALSGSQHWTLTLASYGPQLTDEAPLTQALVALVDHLTPPDEESDEEPTVGNPDDSAAVVTDLPLPKNVEWEL